MSRFPFYGPPFPYYNPYHRNHFSNFNPSVHAPESPISSNNDSYKNESCSKNQKKDDYWLDIFGIKLYYDDVLILSLLFFLYKEEVKDEWLFLALVLLLIS